MAAIWSSTSNKKLITKSVETGTCIRAISTDFIIITRYLYTIIMKQKSMLLVALLATFLVYAKADNFYEPYRQTALRLPAVPLITNDPYFTLWSPYDHLNDGNITHWSPRQKPLEGLLRVDGQVYRFMGTPAKKLLDVVAPNAEDAEWEGRYTTDTPADGWQKPGFDDTAWKQGKAAFGTKENLTMRTLWTGDDSNIYIRRTVTLTADQLARDLYVIWSHDDDGTLFINGTQVRSEKGYRDGARIALTADMKRLLHEGENLIAMHGHNGTKGALADFGLYCDAAPVLKEIRQARQTSVSVLATSTYYTFECGPVKLDVVFTSPMLYDDFELLSTPVGYISYRVAATDGKAHDVQFFMGADPMVAKFKKPQPTRSTFETHNGVNYVKTGTINQAILATKGDGVCIDWGYFYMPAVNGTVSLGESTAMMTAFIRKGALLATQTEMISRKSYDVPTLAYMRNLGQVTTAESYMMIGYDEIYDIEYMFHRYKGYWARDGRTTIFDAFDRYHRDYQNIMERSRLLDKRIYDDALAAGNVHYAELLSASYRHVMAAHKLFEDNDGNLLFFSKENASNGCVNTVDLTYPSAPLFLIYNPDLLKAMMTSIFEYSRSGRWDKPFAAHDLGTYPIANGQVYGADMPLEEAGNMLTLAAEISRIEGNTAYADRYWDIITTWADYLVEHGLDPANQLCTDDFAGHWAHNANLALKAIMGVAGYAKMAEIRGNADVAKRYMDKAREMGKQWEQMAREGDHYRLAYDREGTWSQKYNIVWDKMWGTHIFSDKVMDREFKYYLTKQNKYGLPLDCRKDYTKSDWIMWLAGMAPNAKTFEALMDPVYTYVNETPTRVPISDWHNTKTGRQQGFKARSVIGGYWMKVLMDKNKKK